MRTLKYLAKRFRCLVSGGHVWSPVHVAVVLPFAQDHTLGREADWVLEECLDCGKHRGVA